MRILIVAPEQIPVPALLGGSVEITLLAIAKRLAAFHEVTVVSRTHPRYPHHSLVSGVSVYRVPSGSPMKYLANVRRFLAGRRYDLIQIDNRPKFVPSLKHMFPNATVVLFLHSLTFVHRPYATPAAAGQGLDAADLIVANSGSLKRRLSAQFPRVSGKIRKVWLGVDTGRFTPSRRNKGTSGPFKLLFVGRLIPRKGVPVLLRAATLVRARTARRLTLLIAGGSFKNKYAGRMRRLARSLGVRARFLGTVPHRHIHRVYRRADAFICPSQKHEAFGLVNIEAMSSGLPVIASRLGGIKEVVRHERNGLLIGQYRKPEAFAKAIARLMRDPAFRRRMGRQARKDALRCFSWSATAGRLSRIYSAARAGTDA